MRSRIGQMLVGWYYTPSPSLAKQIAENETHRAHGVTFGQAAEAFFDPFLRVTDASADEEARDAVIGMDEAWDLLQAVHIMLGTGRIRIESTRKATRLERRWYED